MKNTINHIVFILLACYLTSCSVIFEEDIENLAIENTFPINNEVIHEGTFIFRWTPVEDADNYRIQATLNNAIILDTLVTKNYLNYSLPDDTYAWKVRGENFAYTTAYSNETLFTIKNPENITEALVVLTSPLNNYYTNQNTLNFSWETVENSDSYEIQFIKNPNTIVLPYTAVTATKYTPEASVLNSDASYTWSVRALNSNTDTKTNNFSSTFFIDTTAPNIPSQTAPTDSSTFAVNTDISFEWLLNSDVGDVESPITYTLEVSTASNMETTFQQFENITTTNKTISFAIANTYYWRIKATDEASNKTLSIIQSIIIN